MEKRINNIVLVLKFTFFGVWGVCALLYFLGVQGVFASDIDPRTNAGYILKYICVGLTLAGVPLALKLFTLNTTKNLRRMNFDEALISYNVWSMVRMSILELVAVFGFITYFMLNDVSCAVCSLIALTATLMCYPSKSKIKYYLENLNNNQD